MHGAGGATYRLTMLGDDAAVAAAALAAVAGTAAAATSSGSRADPAAATVARPIRNLGTRDMMILLGD